MMIIFNSLEYANKLKKAGIQPEHAEAQAQALNEAMREVIENKLVTKENIGELKQEIISVRQELKQEIVSVRQELKQEIGSVRQELKQEIKGLRQDIYCIRMEMKDIKYDLEGKIKDVENKLSARMGIMLAASVSILIALQTFLHIH